MLETCSTGHKTGASKRQPIMGQALLRPAVLTLASATGNGACCGPRGCRRVTKGCRDQAETADRPYDIVLFGATGFVGELTAEYLAANAPDGLRWAIAGRSEEKLRRLRERLPGAADVGVLRADVPIRPRCANSPSGRAVATTVGPYVQYGEALVAACAETGADYLDLTGEPEFVDLTYVRHDARARETARGWCTPVVSTRAARSRCVLHRAAAAGGACRGRGRLRDRRRRLLWRYVRLRAGSAARGRQLQAAARERRRHEPRLVGRRAATPTGARRGSPGRWGPGRCRCRPSTRRSCAAPRRRWTATAPTSATATTRPCGVCPSRWAGWRPWARSWRRLR